MRTFFFSILCFFQLLAIAQQPYHKGDVVANFTAAKILNHTSLSGDFKSLQKKITIVDFFGTWCAPCIRALPNLTSLQQKHPAEVAVVLISIEKEAQLKKFISSRQGFAFPVIVDENSSISNLFQPPSYPYTVVINGSNQVIAITEASGITDDLIAQWLVAKQSTPLLRELPEPTQPKQPDIQMDNPNRSNNAYTSLSADFIYAAKTGNETSKLVEQLKNINFDSLVAGLSTDDNRKAFWINIYNGYTQLVLKKDPGKYTNRRAFFKAKQINIAGKILSLEEIEHDFLRRSKVKWSLGYLNKFFPGKLERQLRVDKLDYRIHFALNCGAKSCPPIAFYDPATINTQLDMATRAYLTGDVVYNTEKNSLQLPAIMGWFRHDFEGKKNMLRLLKKYSIVAEDKYPSISFKKFNWNLYLSNYKH